MRNLNDRKNLMYLEPGEGMGWCIDFLAGNAAAWMRNSFYYASYNRSFSFIGGRLTRMDKVHV